MRLAVVGKRASFAARILGGAGYALFPFFPLGYARGRSAERRILINPRLAARAPVTTGARRSALHRDVVTAPGRAF